MRHTSEAQIRYWGYVMLTVVFSTYNGEETLPLMLKALSELTPPEGGWKLIVVDNNSTDSTAKLLSSYISKLPMVIAEEEKKGKNHALNSVLDQCEGNLIVFTDDDVIPDKNWLVKYRQNADEQPEYTIFGGRTEPFWMKSPESWIMDWVDKEVVFACSPDIVITHDTCAGYIWGPNMAIRNNIFKQGMRFDVSIGPDGSKNYMMGSETSLISTLLNQGYKCWFDMDNTVKHIITESQLEKKWILGRAVRYGRSLYGEDFKESKAIKSYIFGVPRYYFRLYFEAWGRCVSGFVGGDNKRIFHAKWEMNILKGKMLEAYLRRNTIGHC